LPVSKISERVFLVDTMALGQPGAVAVYAVKGEKVAIVDCGYTSSFESVLQGLSELSISTNDVRYIIPTHVHLDHAGGASPLLQRMPNARVLVHEKGLPHLIDPTRLIQSSTIVFGEEIIRIIGIPSGVDPERTTALGAETHVDLGGISLTAFHTPGHAPHHVSVVIEEEKLLILGDAIGITYPRVRTVIPATPPPSFDPAKVRDTLGKMRQMDSKKLLAPHYGVRRDVASILETTERKTEAWLKKVRQLKKGMLLDDMVPRFQREVAKDARMKFEELPQYAKLSTRITVMGMLHYLNRDA
jgi:glyoxylase-like metal-dependent hydrolase (beta-lactamase superfamily II)